MGLFTGHIYNARYFIVYLNSLSLTACLSGWYGPNCADKCGIHCHSCNRFNGDCEFGCTPGWKGRFCEQGIIEI